MAGSLKQGRALCFCLEVEHPEEAEEMRIADCLHDKDDGKRRTKRRDLVVSIHSSSLAASSAAAASNSGDSYSPRSLLSRLLASIQKPTPAAGSNDGGGAAEVGNREGLGCLKYSSNRKGDEMKSGNGEEVVKEKIEVVERAPLPAPAVAPPVSTESAKGEGSGLEFGGSKRELILSSGKKLEDVSLNLGMGVGLVFLMTRSATELGKMVELREQMQMLIEEIKCGILKKEVSSSCSESNNAAVVSYSYGNENTSRHSDFTSKENRRVNKLKTSAEERSSACSTPKRTKRRLNFNEMEEQLEVELERLQFTMQDSKQLATSHQGINGLATVEVDQSLSYKRNIQELQEVAEESSSISSGVPARELEKRLNQLLEARRQQGLAELESSFDCTEDPRDDDDDYSESFSGDAVEELNEVTNGEASHCGVSARELERKLHELMETRQDERIAELESALECAKRKLLEKEQEVCWWKDTARLVSQRKDEALFR